MGIVDGIMIDHEKEILSVYEKYYTKTFLNKSMKEGAFAQKIGTVSKHSKIRLAVIFLDRMIEKWGGAITPTAAKVILSEVMGRSAGEAVIRKRYGIPSRKADDISPFFRYNHYQKEILNSEIIQDFKTEYLALKKAINRSKYNRYKKDSPVFKFTEKEKAKRLI